MAWLVIKRNARIWAALIECCKQALPLFPEVEEGRAAVGRFKERILLLLADAAEAQGGMGLARRYDEKAKTLRSGCQVEGKFTGFVACDRRMASELLAQGRPNEAARILMKDAPICYCHILFPRINFSDLGILKPQMAALKVLLDALMQTGDSSNILNATLFRADVEETEAVISGHWEGVLEEARRELREQQWAGGLGAAGAGEGGPEAKKKSKAAKQKQQKRKAQQQKRAAEVAEAAAAAAVAAAAHGGALEQEEQGQEQQQQQQALKEQEEEQEEEEDDEEQEGKRNDNEHFWVERCTIKCIEPTCPYCRSPLQEMGSI